MTAQLIDTDAECRHNGKRHDLSCLWSSVFKDKKYWQQTADQDDSTKQHIMLCYYSSSPCNSQTRQQAEHYTEQNPLPLILHFSTCLRSNFLRYETSRAFRITHPPFRWQTAAVRQAYKNNCPQKNCWQHPLRSSSHQIIKHSL